MVCPYCKNENGGSKKFCGHCGKPLPYEKRELPYEKRDYLSIIKVLTFNPLLFFIDKRKMKKEYDRNPISLNGEQVKKYIKFFKLSAILCFFLNAVFIFIPIFHDPSALTTLFNEANDYFGSSRDIVTNYSQISIFNVLFDGEYHTIAVIYAIIHVIMCALSALMTVTYKNGNMLLQKLTSVGTVFVLIIVGILVAIGTQTYGLPYPCKGTIILPILSSSLVIRLIDMIVLSSKDINGGSEL